MFFGGERINSNMDYSLEKLPKLDAEEKQRSLKTSPRS